MTIILYCIFTIFKKKNNFAGAEKNLIIINNIYIVCLYLKQIKLILFHYKIKIK